MIAALELLVLQTTKESGRQLADLCARLEQMTGQTFGKNPQAWLDWWEQNKDTLETTSLLVTQPVRRQEGEGKRYFGVELESLRVVFVLDISQTMGASLDDPQDLFPPEGKSRLDMARREVKAAILALSPDAVFAVGETVYFACDRCHGLYWIDDKDRGRIRDTPRSPAP